MSYAHQQRGTVAYRCEVCSGMPTYRIERVGDAAVSWACAEWWHLGWVIERLQQSWRDQTELRVIAPAKVPA